MRLAASSARHRRFGGPPPHWRHVDGLRRLAVDASSPVGIREDDGAVAESTERAVDRRDRFDGTGKEAAGIVAMLRPHEDTNGDRLVSLERRVAVHLDRRRPTRAAGGGERGDGNSERESSCYNAIG